MNTLNRKIIAMALAGLVATGVVGCGNKGPLVLPERPAADSVSDPADEAAPDADASLDDISDEP